MKRNRLLNWIIAIIFFAIPWIQLSAGAKKGIDKKSPLQLKEIKRIDFRDLPEQIEFVNPSRIALNSRNQLFVTDTRAHNIKIFNARGQFLKVIGQEGKGPGDLIRPSCTTFNGKYIIVWELGNFRFSLFNEDGEFIRHFKAPQPAVVWKLKSLKNGQVVFEIHQGYCEDEKAILYILDKELKKGEKFFSHPIKRERYEKKIQDDIKIPFGPLVSWDVMGENKILIGYQEEYKIDIFTPNKEKLMTIEHDRKRVKISQKDRQEYFSSMIYISNGQAVQGAPPLLKKYTEFPKFKPYYKNILISPENEIWVFLNTKSRDQKLVDVFNEDGEFLRQIQLEDDLGFGPVFAEDGTFWTVKEEKGGYHMVIQYQIKKQ